MNIMNPYKLDDEVFRPIRVTLRRKFRVCANVPIVVVKDGAAVPILTGERGGFFTRNGTPVYYPSAYSKKGWSNLIYRRSSQEIQISESFLKEFFGGLSEEELKAKSCPYCSDGECMWCAYMKVHHPSRVKKSFRKAA